MRGVPAASTFEEAQVAVDDREYWQTDDRDSLVRARGDELRLRSRALPRFLAALEDAGRELGPVLQRFGLPADAARVPELELGLDAARELPEAIAAELGRPLLGLELAGALRPTWFGLPELGARASATLGEALRTLARFASMASPAESFALSVDAGEAELSHRVSGTRRALGRQHNELLTAFLVRLVRECVGEPWSPAEVLFAHAAPEDTRPLARFFGTDALRFALGYSGFRFAAKDLELRVVTADAELLAMVEERAAHSLGRGPVDELMVRLRAEVRALLPEGRASLKEVAAKLGASARTLQRRLDEHHTAFNAVVEETRLALAKEYLLNPALALKEIASLVGYADATAFIRAFKRETGLTPLEYRSKRR